ncbi:MAG: alpha/beta hydrolase, partial [Prochlorotrichaceae cyanobacterium]
MRLVWSRFRHLAQRLSVISFYSLGLLGLAAAPGMSLDRITLRPTFLLEDPLPLQELEDFALEGRKSSNMQFLLDLIVGSSDLKEADLQNFLGNVSEVDGVLVDRFLTSAIGEVLVQE